MEVPSLLCSEFGSTRASTAVLSQIEPAPGALMEAQALPPDCGRLPPFELFSASSSAMVVGSWVTVMSAPTLASQTGETDCFTDTDAAPLGWFLSDQFMPPSAEEAETVCERIFAPDMSCKVEASTSSWLQSSLSASISWTTPWSLTLGAVAC